MFKWVAMVEFLLEGQRNDSIFLMDSTAFLASKVQFKCFGSGTLL